MSSLNHKEIDTLRRVKKAETEKEMWAILGEDVDVMEKLIEGDYVDAWVEYGHNFVDISPKGERFLKEVQGGDS